MAVLKGGEKLKKFLTNTKKLGGRIDAGFFPEAIYADGTQVAQVAFDNCFGHINTGSDAEKYGEVISARNFMSMTFEQQKLQWKLRLIEEIDKQKEIGNIDVKLALKKVAFVMKKDIQDTIDWFAEFGEPRNGPKMQAIKGFDSPLIWSGKMRDSVETVVTV